MIQEQNDTALYAVRSAILTNSCFYAYRMPGEKQIYFGAQGESNTVKGKGFTVYPFVENDDTPALFIPAELDVKEFLSQTGADSGAYTHNISNSDTNIDDYLKQVHHIIDEINNGLFSKIVLSRVIVRDYDQIDWTGVFSALIENNKDAFVFIFNTKASGLWIGASPERFLSYHGQNVNTMALAGTRKSGTDSEWGVKEQIEQKIVSEFISDTLQDCGITFVKSDTYTKRAGNVEHLCNDFKGDLEDRSQVESLKSRLHPTPALAGLPKKDAVNEICKIENHNRRYYGGYIGPVDEDGGFDYFVNLRTVEVGDRSYCIYVGGGITKDSIPMDEWNETKMKSETIIHYLKQEE